MKRRPAPLPLRLAGILVVYAVLERWALGLGALPPDAYEGASILLGLLHRLLVPEGAPSLGYLSRLAVTVALLVGTLLRRERSSANWRQISDDRIPQLLTCVAVGILAWAYSTYSYNAYFDQSHISDRLALVGCGALVVWRPVFVLPFAVLVVGIATQFYYPIGGYSVAEQFMLVRVLLLFGAFHIARSVWPDVRAADFTFLVATLVAAGYVASGWGKLNLGWFTHGRVGLLLPGAWGDGWLRMLDAEAVATWTRRALRLDVLMVATTFVVEVLALFALVRRRFFVAFLGLWVVFHLGIVAMAGILFWKWIVFELTFLAAFVGARKAASLEFFSGVHAALSVVLIVGGTVWFQPVNLSWYSVPLSYAYRFEAVDAAGARSTLSPAFFAPYDYQFGLAGFAYLSPETQLPDTWGAQSSRQGAERVVALRDMDEARALESELGGVHARAPAIATMESFLRRFVSARARIEPAAMRRLLAPPRQIQNFAVGTAYQRDDPVVAVEVSQVTVFFDGVRVIESEPVPLLRVEIPEG